jgi:hypothetical protein
MKLTASGVHFSAAITKSPSFSRSASSTTSTIRPSRMSAMASSTDAKTDRSIAASGCVDSSSFISPTFPSDVPT